MRQYINNQTTQDEEILILDNNKNQNKTEPKYETTTNNTYLSNLAVQAAVWVDDEFHIFVKDDSNKVWHNIMNSRGEYT